MDFKVCVLSLFVVLSGFTQANQVTARLIAPVESVIPGDTLLLTTLEITKGWNTYWKMPVLLVFRHRLN